MDRLNRLKNEAGESGDSTLDTSSPPSEAYLTANEGSKYFSLLEDETSFNISKDAGNPEQEAPVSDNSIVSNLSPIPKSDLDNYKIGKQIEAANILSGGVNIFDDNENSYDGDELVIDDNAAIAEEKPAPERKLIDNVHYNKVDENLVGTIEDVDPVIPSKDTEVVLQIDGKNVDAIDIGNGLYLYRKDGEEELAAVQIIDSDQQQSSFKFLKVRENAEGNLEVYEEIEIEVPKETPLKEVNSAANVYQVTMNYVENAVNEPNKVDDKKITTPQKVFPSSETKTVELNKEFHTESKTEVNINGRMMKFSESRKSPVVGSFTPMTFHSTPNKDGIPLTKTMVDQHLHPSRHSDNVKKTIEVHTDSSKQRVLETPVKNNKEVLENKAELSENELKQPSQIQDDRKKTSNKKGQGAQDCTIVRNSNCEKNQDILKSSLEVDNPDAVTNKHENSKTITQVEVIINETGKEISDETNSQDQDGNVNLPVIKNDFETVVFEKKEILESKAKVINSVAKENITIDIESTNTDLNEEKYNKEFKEVRICATELNDKNKNVEYISRDTEVTKNEILNSTEETPGNIDNKISSCETKIAIVLSKESQELDNDKSIPDKQIEVHNTKTESQTMECQAQNIDKPNKVITIEKESVDFDTNLEIQNSKHMIPTVEMPKTSLSQNVLINNHKKNEDRTEVDESTKMLSNNITTELKSDSNSIDVKDEIDMSQVRTKTHSDNKDGTGGSAKETSKVNNDTNIKNISLKPANNNNAAVPFGKWTEANRQEFLNKIKEIKVPSNNPNTKQIKQANDLNRRDVLQKIDSQRQQQTNNAIAKVHEQQKLKVKLEPSAFVKSAVKNDTKIPIKDRPTSRSKPLCNKRNVNDVPANQPTQSSNVTIPAVVKKEPLQRREINNQDLIDKTIEDIINRVSPAIKTSNEERRQRVQNTEGIETQKGMTLFGPSYHAKNEQSVTLDEIEMKMNELHGIPFVERPAHELPQKFVVDAQNSGHTSSQSMASTPSQLPVVKKSQQKMVCDEVVNIDSDEEIIEHEPITGDVIPKKKPTEVVEKPLASEINHTQKVNDVRKKDVIITEKDFDKFFRRNSVTYENCLTVNFDGREPHNVIQTVVEKDAAPKKLTRNEVLLAESKAKSTHKLQMLQARHNNHPTKIPTAIKNQTNDDDAYGKNYQSKLQIAYQSALTAKRQKESPITIIEEKPVKVVFMESNVDFVPCQLNVQGDKLSPVKHITTDLETFNHTNTDSLDSDITDNYDNKSQDEAKIKIKHQRKQVLTPVETPEMELIEPDDLGIEVSPKKKRKIEDKPEKSPRNHVPKKSYLLGRTTNIDDKIKAQDHDKISFKEITNHNSFVGHSNPISAIDNLVKAAELLDNQAENNSNSAKAQVCDTQQITPVKRGRGRPRKYPLPVAEADKAKVPSPQKKPRLIDAKVVRRDDTDSDDTSGDELIKENWTMGKINENIVCPICNKLFRSENVVFKHVKHCTGPSPNRSESDKRRLRVSRDSDQSMIDYEEVAVKKKRKSKESVSKNSTHSDELIGSEDTLSTERPLKQHVSRRSMVKPKISNKQNLICEICGKTFRQSSYLAHHKLQHKNDELKEHEIETNDKKSIFSCEVCKKEFRKLHHLVQHRIIHNSNPVPSRTLRKSSSEQSDCKLVKEQSEVKQNEDQSAGFRCEPCDKSFRKLHHLVEHRETHDGINRQKATDVETVKPAPVHRCDICEKTFRKLQLLNEHKDQHLETCSEKSDDKSVKSSLSTKDIIHECSLCYMVFPNEHSLNKHTVICLRKKKQSAAKAKQAALKKESENDEVDLENNKSEECDPSDVDDSLIIIEDNEIQDLSETKQNELENDKPVEKVTLIKSEPIIINSVENLLVEQEDNVRECIKQDTLKVLLTKPVENLPVKPASDTIYVNKDVDVPAQTQAKTKQKEEHVTQKEIEKPVYKRRTPAKDKLAATVTKRKKSVAAVKECKPSVESSDDDEIRYMLNPDFKEVQTAERKNFMKVKANKRNSLQIERPNSKDLVKRRISLQHPPRISRLKSKLEHKPTPAASTKAVVETIEKQAAAEPMDFTDSEDSDTKYAFPETMKQNTSSAAKAEKRPQKRKSLGLKRKSLNGIAKRKSLGKAINSKHKLKPEPPKPVKKRTTEVEHRCDCGKLFSSAALLSRHTTLDHTPPRIRRRRSPAPDKPIAEAADRAVAAAGAKRNGGAKKPKERDAPDTAAGRSRAAARTSAASGNEARAPRGGVALAAKTRASTSGARRGVPVPDKVRQLMERSKV